MPLTRAFGKILVEHAAQAVGRGNVFFAVSPGFMSNQARYLGGRSAEAFKQASAKALEFQASTKGQRLLGRVGTGLSLAGTVANMIAMKDTKDSYDKGEINVAQATLGLTSSCLGIYGAWGKATHAVLCSNLNFYTIVHKNVGGMLVGQRSENNIKSSIIDIFNAALGCLGSRLPGGFGQQGMSALSLGISTYTSNNCTILAQQLSQHGRAAVESTQQSGMQALERFQDAGGQAMTEARQWSEDAFREGERMRQDAYRRAQETGQRVVVAGRRRASEMVAHGAATAAVLHGWLEQHAPSDAAIEVAMLTL